MIPSDVSKGNTLPRSIPWKSGHAGRVQSASAFRQLLERGTHRWEVQRLLTRFYRERSRPLPLSRLLNFYTLSARKGAWKLELVRGAAPYSLLSPARLGDRKIAFVECHGDDLYLRAAVFLKRLIGGAKEAWWLTMVDDCYGVRDQEGQDEQTKRRLRSLEARRGAIELGLSAGHVVTGCCRWPLLQGAYAPDGRLLA